MRTFGSRYSDTFAAIRLMRSSSTPYVIEWFSTATAGWSGFPRALERNKSIESSVGLISRRLLALGLRLRPRRGRLRRYRANRDSCSVYGSAGSDTKGSARDKWPSANANWPRAVSQASSALIRACAARAAAACAVSRSRIVPTPAW